MSNNRKCNYLVVDVGTLETIMMGINTQGITKDIILIKEFRNKSFDELAQEAYWLCKEFDIQIILADRLGCGIGFIDSFNNLFSNRIVSIRGINIFSEESRELFQSAYFCIEKDLNMGILRFLQSKNIAHTSYSKSFLGYSNIMEFHNETDKLIEEFSNIDLYIKCGNVKLGRIDDKLSKSRVNCLLIYYSYPNICIDKTNINKDKEDYDIAKKMVKYSIARNVFFKYVFKSIENNNLKTIFYYSNKNKIIQFQNFAREIDFIEMFDTYIKQVRISKDNFEIIFNNGSIICFRIGNDSSKGNRYHFAVVDTEIEPEKLAEVICPKGILFDIAKQHGLLKDNYNIEYIEM
jgi:hypothetical protein